MICLLVLILGAVLWIRKNLVHTEFKGRVVPFREALVPPGFANPTVFEAPYTILWILRDYGPDASATSKTIHSWNLFLKGIGWRPVVAIPDGGNILWEDIPVLEFWQKFEIETTLLQAKVIGAGPMVIEMAAATAANAGRPLFLAIGDEGQEEFIRKAIHLQPACSLLYTAGWLQEKYGIPGTVVHRDLRLKARGTSRQQITCLGVDSESWLQFSELARRMPEQFFLAVARGGEEIPGSGGGANLAVMGGRDPWIQETGILLVFSELAATPELLEVAMEGIPILAAAGGATWIQEMLGDSVEFLEEARPKIWMERIQNLRENSVEYELAGRRVKEAAAEWNVRPELERLRIAIQDMPAPAPRQN